MHCKVHVEVLSVDPETPVPVPRIPAMLPPFIMYLGAKKHTPTPQQTNTLDSEEEDPGLFCSDSTASFIR